MEKMEFKKLSGKLLPFFNFFTLSISIFFALYLRTMHITAGFIQSDEINDWERALAFLRNGFYEFMNPSMYRLVGHLPLNGFMIAVLLDVLQLQASEVNNIEYPFEMFARIVPISFGVLTVIGVYLLGRRCDTKHGEMVGLLSAFLLAFSGFHVLYSQIITPYSFLCFSFLLAFYLLAKDDANSFLILIIFAVSVFASLFAVYLIVISVIFILITRGGRSSELFNLRLVGCVFVALVAFMFVMIMMLRSGNLMGDAELFAGVGYYDWSPVNGAFFTRGYVLYYFEAMRDYFTWPVVLLAIGGSIVALKERKRDAILVFLWFICTLVLLSLMNGKMPRYMMLFVPALYILTSIGIVRICSCFGQTRYICMATIVGFIIVNQPVLAEYIHDNFIVTGGDWLVDGRKIGNEVNLIMEKKEGMSVISDYWTTGNYIRKGYKHAVISASVLERNLSYTGVVIVSIWQKGRYGSGGGPVLVYANISGLGIYLSTLNLSEMKKSGILRELEKDGEIEIFDYSDKNWLDKTALVMKKDKKVIIVGLTSENNFQGFYFSDVSCKIYGGPYYGIVYKGRVVDVVANGFIYDCNINVDEVAITKDYWLLRSEFDEEAFTSFGRPVVWIYAKKVDD